MKRKEYIKAKKYANRLYKASVRYNKFRGVKITDPCKIVWIKSHARPIKASLLKKMLKNGGKDIVRIYKEKFNIGNIYDSIKFTEKEGRYIICLKADVIFGCIYTDLDIIDIRGDFYGFLKTLKNN